MSDAKPSQPGRPERPAQGGQSSQSSQPAQASQPNPAADEFALPAGLVADLAAVCEGPITVPDEVDEAVLAAARAYFGDSEAVPTMADSGERRLDIRWWLGAAGTLAAAAAIALVVMVGLDPHGGTSGDPGTQPGAGEHPGAGAGALAGDVDQSGQVDVVDAFKLARQLEDGVEIPPMVQYDLNRDGAVNRDDVDAIANMVVKLEAGEGPNS